MTELSAIAEYLNGTCKSADDAANEFDVELDTVYKAIEENEIENCACCNWWFELSEIVTDAQGDLVCESCKSDEEEE